MDPIALLSELHGNGRETLQKLRSSGMTDIRLIAGADTAALARILGIGERSAKRFQHEARAMMQGNIFHAAEGVAEPAPQAAVQPKEPLLAPPVSDSFKLQVVELVARRFL